MMKKSPWTTIGVACLILVLLVAGRSAVTAGRVLYYGGTDWVSKVMEDSWLYVGVAAAVMGVVAFLLAEVFKKEEPEEPEIE